MRRRWLLALPALALAAGAAGWVSLERRTPWDRCGDPPPAMATAPQTFLLPDDIAAIRGAVAAGREPQASALARLLRDADAALALAPPSVTRQGDPGPAYVSELPYCGWTRREGKEPDCRDGAVNPGADRGDYEAAIAAGDAARDLALAHLFTGDDRYAAQAVQVVEGWTTDPATGMQPSFGNLQSRIELFITLPALAYAADLLRGWPGWPADRQAAVHRWFQAIAAEAESFRHENNFEDWRLVLLGTVAALTGDRCRINATAQAARDLIPRQIDREGFMVKELDRADSLSYSLFALDALVQLAELGRAWGIDLHGYRTPDGVGLETALDRHAPFAAGAAPWPHGQQAPLTVADNVSLYELAAKAYGKPAYRAVVDHWGRPLRSTRVLGPVSLTHAATAP